MPKVKSLEELKSLCRDLKDRVDLREKGENIDCMTVVKVGMGSCGIEAGAHDLLKHVAAEVKRLGMDEVVVLHGDCMGYCQQEPTVQVILPGEQPVVYGNVDQAKATEIVEKYIKNGDVIEGYLPATQAHLDK